MDEDKTITLDFVRATIQKRIDKIIEKLKECQHELDISIGLKLNNAIGLNRIEVMRCYASIDNLVSIAKELGVNDLNVPEY